MDQSLDAGELKRCGWLQGSIINPELVEYLITIGELPTVSEIGYWVVLSHDCDVTNLSFDAEPRVEVIFGKLIDPHEKDGNQEWGKNARLLQLSDPPDSQPQEHLQFNVHQRHWFSRSNLCKHKPASRILNPEIISRLSAWIAKRYVRSGFPDEFVERTRVAVSKIRKKSKKDGQYITGLYLLLKDVELTPSEEYEIIIIASMRPQHYENVEIQKIGNRLLGEIEAFISDCKGIDVKTIELRSESKISLTELRFMKRWDFDDLTLRGDSQNAVPSTP